jgi:hypothetical protein
MSDGIVIVSTPIFHAALFREQSTDGKVSGIR